MNKVRIKPIDGSFAKHSYKYRNNTELWEFMKCDTPFPATEESERLYYEDMKNVSDVHMFAVIFDDVFVGCVKLKCIDRGYAELSYYLFNRQYWGKGICKEAIRQILEFGFNVVNLDLIAAFINPDNVRSYNMILSLDFYRAGISIKNLNVERLEITRSRWRTSTAKKSA